MRNFRILLGTLVVAILLVPAITIFADKTVTVKSGEGWAQLAEKYCKDGTSAAALARYNGKSVSTTPSGSIKIPSSLSNERSAKITSVSGTVEVNGKAASKNQSLAKGQTVTTGSGSRADIQLDNGTVMRLGADSKLKITELVLEGRASSTSTDLEKGSASMQVTRLNRGSSFSVSTVSAVAGVRGTYFYINSDDKSKDVNIACYSGKVVVSRINADGSVDTKNPVSVNAGYATTINGKTGEAEKPFPIPAKIEWADSDNK